MTSPLSPDVPVELVVEEDVAGARLDAFLASHFPDYSRVHLRRAITAGGVEVDGRGGKPAYRLKAGQRVRIVLPELPREAPTPEDIPIDVLYEDADLVVVNKRPGMVVHPARGHWTGTLASALQFHYGPSLSGSGGPTRPGIVHRLDRDTSGVLLIARSDQAHARLAAQYAERSIQKEYFAIVAGVPQRDRDQIDRPIGPHPHTREKMAIRTEPDVGRPAQTFYEVAERFKGFATLRVLPKTGRTHQIRVHLCHAGFPVLCDRQYGGRSQITRGEITGQLEDGVILLDRHALHARKITFLHPANGAPLTIEAPLPADLQAVVAALREKP
ncbi:MAG: RluA family pseudouridine synthase [Patescibacteria group bacterium]|nr:RluA family pseudouridine synthase [Patescibacteria group bacterium]